MSNKSSLPTCYDFQQQIKSQKAALQALDSQIDLQQSHATNLLKQTVIKKHLQIQRVFITEEFIRGRIKDPLNTVPFTATDLDVSPNFASLDLPDDFSKGPMKAFLNDFLDSLDNFLPSFYMLNPSKIPPNPKYADQTAILLRCVFPTLFGYSWSKESSQAYANNIVTWFGEIYKTKPTILQNFENHWMSKCITGFFSTLNLSQFVSTTIKPLLWEFVQLSANDQRSPSIILTFSTRLLASIHENFRFLPSVLNKFYRDLLQIVTPDLHATVIRYFFYETIIRPCLDNPLLASVSDIMLPINDYSQFSKLYIPFELKFNCCEEKSPLVEEIQKLQEFSQFQPMSVMDDINAQKASQELLTLEEFCQIVQCAHQPLLMSTHHLSLLFRFVASLQHTGFLPSSISRSISNVSQQALPDKLEVLPNQYFWFPCYSLTYLSISSIKFSSESKTIPIYKLLSNENFRVNPNELDFNKALEKATYATPINSHPEIKMEYKWLCENYKQDFTLSLAEEISKKQKEIEKKRKRSLALSSFTKFLEDEKSSILFGQYQALSIAIFPQFAGRYPEKINSNAFLTKLLDRAEEFCGKSFELIAPYFIASFLIETTQWIKAIPSNEKEEEIDEEIREIQKCISKPFQVSSFLPIGQSLAKDLMFLDEYAKLSNMNFEELVKKVYVPPFSSKTADLAGQISLGLLSLPTKLLSFVLSNDELSLLKRFVSIYGVK
ncbi:hypothetical protein GPJ56_000176 [Histomonas meleagridis]|uniref:uncharacterized protein n=1 Tax=Histomonas meleagridis TaxID=135588 RepID=UPI00355A1DB0|nr:hypothetical protein GPJ56_000176 [Histomonas meleagridis]KAH0806590.1 hypothetical protein GO595_000752 [Histomonas meleagridis]